MRKTVIIEARANLRPYTYTAHLSAATGKLLRITAGCRTWKTFEQAENHYRGIGKEYPNGTFQWKDSTIDNRLHSAAGSTEDLKRAAVIYSCRCEARGILSNLKERVESKQHQMKIARRRKKAMQRFIRECR